MRNLSLHEYTCNHADMHMNQQFRRQKWSFNAIPCKLVSTWRHLANTLSVFQHYSYLCSVSHPDPSNKLYATHMLSSLLSKTSHISAISRPVLENWSNLLEGVGVLDGRGKIFLFFSFFSHFLIEFLKNFEKSQIFWKFIFYHFFQNSFAETF